LTGQRPAGAQRRGDDRRGDAHRPGAADRRPQGEVAGGAAGGDQTGPRPGAQRGRRGGDPGARAQRARVRLRRRGLEGRRGRARQISMEAVGALGRRGLSPYLEAVRAWVSSRSRVFWLVAGLTAVAAALRFVTLGAQSYHHDEVITASRLLR